MDNASPLAPLNAELTEVNPSATISPQHGELPSNTEVTELTELTEVNSEPLLKSSAEPAAKLEDLKGVYWHYDGLGA